MMRKFLTGIFLFVLMLAQFASISHAVDYAFDDKHKNLPQHECVLCHADIGIPFVEAESNFNISSFLKGNLFFVDIHFIYINKAYKPYQGRSPPLNLAS
ncbi:MAG: hypothetical protein ACI9TY_001295 [Alphaproteobacteria bacterium]|jgi:hypothetical protein